MNITPAWLRGRVPADGAGRHLTTLDKLTAAALVVMSPLLVFGMMIVGGSIDWIALAAGATALLAAAGVMLTGRKWAPLLAAVPGALTFAVAGRFIIQSLFTPYETLNFGFWTALMAIMGVATVASITSTAQHYLWPSVGGVPWWVFSAMVAIGALCVGAIVVAALPRLPVGVQIQPESLAQLPAVVSKDFKWDRTELRAKAGQTVTLRLDNIDQGPHSFDIDELNVHAPMAGGQQSLVVFTPSQPGTYSFYCAVGTHRKAGMEGTLIVEP
jgi:plastocyanin